MGESLFKTYIIAAAAAIVGGTCSGVFIWIFQGHTLEIVPQQISYPDLIAVLLTGVGLLLSVVGLAVAFIAIYGFRHFKKTAETVATSKAQIIAVDRLQTFLGGEEASMLINAQVRTLVVEILENKGTYSAWNREASAEAAKMDELDRSDG